MYRYKDNPLVAGMDLRNEPRIAHGIINLWGGNDTKPDYASAMEKAGNIIKQEQIKEEQSFNFISLHTRISYLIA